MAFYSLFSRWRGRRVDIPDALWMTALARHPYARALGPADQERLVSLAAGFLAAKAVDGADGLIPTEEMRAHVAIRASVPILHLGLEYYSDWYAVVLYPSDFRVHDEFVDETGVVHRGNRELCGESLTQGPVVLSWPAIEEDMQHIDLDLVIHECAHKIDLLNGDADGYPPLHAGMNPQQWTESFRQAYESFCEAVEREQPVTLDPYAATDPAEFFAVVSETFFVTPWLVASELPAVYEQLRLFYRQDPVVVLAGNST
jgi:Mlc titration factor MtfA (ptsG expression regulator)